MFVKVLVLLLAFSVAVASVAIVGAPVDVDINCSDVQDALQFAVTEYNNKSNKPYNSQVVKVIKAQKQIVAGENYTFTVLMAREPGSPCAISSDPAIAQVLALLLVFSVANVENFADVVDVDINSPEVQGALQFAVNEHNEMSDKRYTSQVLKVIKAQEEGITGEKYIFTVLMARSDCSHSKPGSPCAVNSDPAIAQVLALLLVFSVANVENFADVVDVDINSPEVQGALQFAVNEHNEMSDKRYTSQVVKVIKAQEEGITGEKYILTVLMARSDCSHSKPGSPCAINSDPAIAQ
ncbi:cystatin-like, partial [Clarias magur]